MHYETACARGQDAIVARAGRAIAFGWMVGLVAVGLASLLTRCQTAFEALKWLGVAYLVFLGVRLLVRHPDVDPQELQAQRRSPAALARQEFLVAAANPKALLLFAAFIPQFVDRHHPAAPQLFILGPIYILVEVAAASIWAAAGAKLGRSSISRRARKWFDRNHRSRLPGPRRDPRHR